MAPDPSTDAIDTLWRGSNLGADSGTLGLYRVAGIVSRLPHGGDPDYVQRAGLWRAVGAHVTPVGEREKRFLATSTFISFSESEDRARYYAAGRGAHGLEPCGVYEEDAVVFELNTAGRTALQTPGVYEVKFRCDLTRVIPLHDTEDERASAAAIRCEFCAGNAREHSLVLIDVVRFLEAAATAVTSPRALSSARDDKEWLVWPTDFVPRLHGFSAMIPPSTIWTSHHFRYT